MAEEEAAGFVAGLFGAFFVLWLVVYVFFAACGWIVFSKAGKPGWAAIVPIYNIIVLLEIVGRPIWWVIGAFIPFVGFILMIILDLDLAKSFGKGTGFAVGLILLPIIFLPLLAFGDAKYVGPAAAQA